PFPDGRHLLLGPDAEMTCKEIAKFSRRDAEAYPRYEAMLERVADVIEPPLTEAPPDLLRPGPGGPWKLFSVSRASRRPGAAAGELRCGAEVSRVLVEKGRAAGVVLAGGDELRAPVVASNADANVTFLRLLEERQLPPDFVEAVRRIDYSSASLKINLALSELPDFRACPGARPGPQHRGTIHVCPDLDYIER